MSAVKINDLNRLRKSATFFSFADDKDTRQLIGFLLVYWLAWTLSVGLLSKSIVLDSVEQTVWSQTWQWGYYKHPPLPSILMAGLNRLLNGPSMWLTVFAAQGCAVVALIYVWLLASRILPHRLAIAAVLITSMIGYHNYTATSFDHNTVSLPFSAAVLYYFYRAIHDPRRIFNWIILGLASGLAMLTKYSALLVIAGPFVYLIWQNSWASFLIIRGLLVSIIVFALVLLPHVMWLENHNWLPFGYFYYELNMPNSRFDILAAFFVGQILPFLPLLLAIGLISKISQHKPVLANSSKISHRDADWRFLIATLFTPTLLALLPTLLNGNYLFRSWVCAFFLPAGIAIVKYFSDKYNQEQLLQNTRNVVWSFQTVILLLFVSGKIIYPNLTGHEVRTNFPSKLLAEQVSAIWRQHQQQPLTIVIADTWLAGNVLLHTRPEPTVLLNNDLGISTWLNQQDVANCGAMLLTTMQERSAKPYSALFEQAVATGSFSLQWGDSSREYAWAVLSPESNAKDCRLSQD